jgi:carbon monoxide dehydrogenase subunit G
LQFTGTVTIDAPRAEVWKFLTDPHSVSLCAPGLESLDIIIPDKQFKAVASVGFGSVSVKFNMNVEWLELDPPNRGKIKARGSAPGSAVEGSSEMILRDLPNGSTDLDWSADVMVFGTIASLASRLMGSLTRRLTGQFFDCVKAKIEG